MVTPPRNLKVPVRATSTTSPAPKLSLAKPIVTKELGKLTTTSASPALVRMLDKLKAPVVSALPGAPKSPVASATTSAKVGALLAKAPDLSPTSSKRDLVLCAEKLLPIAQKPSTRGKFLSLTHDNKRPNEETCLSRVKVHPVVEGKTPNPSTGSNAATAAAIANAATANATTAKAATGSDVATAAAIANAAVIANVPFDEDKDIPKSATAATANGSTANAETTATATATHAITSPIVEGKPPQKIQRLCGPGPRGVQLLPNDEDLQQISGGWDVRIQLQPGPMSLPQNAAIVEAATESNAATATAATVEINADSANAATVEVGSNAATANAATAEVNNQWTLVSPRRKKSTARAAASIAKDPQTDNDADANNPNNNNNNNNIGTTAKSAAIRPYIF